MKVAFFEGTDRGRTRLGTLEIKRGKLVARGSKKRMLQTVAKGLMEGEPKVFAVGGTSVTVKDGKAFLEALPLLYRPPYFFAEVEA